MRKSLAMVLCSSLGLAGCVAVPVYGPGYGASGYGAPAVYVAPPAVEVRPYVYGGYGDYGGHSHRGGRGY